MIYLLGVLIVTAFGFGTCLILWGVSGDNKDRVKRFMQMRERNMQQILDEDFGEEGIFQTESGEAYHVQMGKYGSFIVVDVLSSYDKVETTGVSLKLKTKGQKNGQNQQNQNQTKKK